MYDKIASVTKIIEEAPINPCWKCHKLDKKNCSCDKLQEYKAIIVNLKENYVVDPEICIALHQIAESNIHLQELPENVRVEVDKTYSKFYYDLILQEHGSFCELEAFIRLLIDWYKGNKILYTLYGLRCLDDVKSEHIKEPDSKQSVQIDIGAEQPSSNEKLQDIEKEVQKLETDMQQCLKKRDELSNRLMKLF